MTGTLDWDAIEAAREWGADPLDTAPRTRLVVTRLLRIGDELDGLSVEHPSPVERDACAREAQRYYRDALGEYQQAMDDGEHAA